MKMYPKILAASVAALSSLTYGAGFQISEHSASGLGRAYAGEAAMIDSAAVLARNPAAANFFKEQTVSIVGHYIDPSIDVEGQNNSAVTPSPAVDASQKDVAPSAFVPGLFYIAPLNEHLAFGLAVTSHFGLKSEYETSFGGAEFAGESSVKSVYITPSLSVKVSEDLSLGLGINYIQGEGVLKNTFSPTLAPVVGQPAGGDALNLEADGDGFGWNFGLMWQANSKVRIGLRYMSAVDLDTDAEYTKFGLSGEQKGTLTLNLPDVFELAYNMQVSDQVVLSASAQYTGWSSFKKLEVKNDDGQKVLIKEENWHNAMRYALGVDYQINDGVAVRMGYAFDESPVADADRTLTIPDSDRNWLSLGASFGVGKGVVDTGITYVKGKSVKVNEQTKAPSGLVISEFNGKLSKSDVLIYSVGYNVSF